LKKALIVYWSATGNTEKVAFAIRDGLKDAGVDVNVVKTKGSEVLDYFEYDLVCVGSPVHQFHLPEPMSKFLKGMFTKYGNEKRILPNAPTVKGKHALVFCTWAGGHTGVDEALPAVKYMGQFFAHVGIEVVDEWYVPGELFYGEVGEVAYYNVNGRLGDIRGRPTGEELKKVRLDALKLGKGLIED
jgi:flavodoxin I